MSARFLTAAGREGERALESQLEDYMEDAAIWPIYPELGAPRGISDKMIWRRKNGDIHGTLDLGTFVKHSCKYLAKAAKESFAASDSRF